MNVVKKYSFWFATAHTNGEGDHSVADGGDGGGHATRLWRFFRRQGGRTIHSTPFVSLNSTLFHLPPPKRQASVYTNYHALSQEQIK
jgi:hypothetical protein